MSRRARTVVAVDASRLCAFVEPARGAIERYRARKFDECDALDERRERARVDRLPERFLDRLGGHGELGEDFRGGRVRSDQ